MTAKNDILREASDLLDGQRQADYGTPDQNFADIASGWRVIFGPGVTPDKVALAMAWLKICRAKNGKSWDSYVDGAAYMALAGELAQPRPIGPYDV